MFTSATTKGTFYA